MDMLHIFLILCYVLSVVTYLAYKYKDNINEIKKRIVQQNITTIFQYMLGMGIENFVSFEKYEVWRFSTIY